MTSRYDAIAVRKYTDRDGNEKSIFTNIGVAFKMRDKDGYSVRLHAMPAPADGEFTILLMPPKARDGGSQSSAPRQQSAGGGMDDDIPF